MIASCWIANVRLLFAFFLFTEAEERPRPVFWGAGDRPERATTEAWTSIALMPSPILTLRGASGGCFSHEIICQRYLCFLAS